MSNARLLQLSLALGGLVALVDCGHSAAPAASGQGGAGGNVTGAAGAAGHSGPGAGGAGQTTTGAAGATTGAGGTMPGAGGRGPTGQGGAPGVVTCTPGVQEALITDCGYPTAGAAAPTLAAVMFSEDEVLRGIQPEGAAPSGIVRLFYNDEHALTLGVRSVVVKAASGTTTMDYPVSPLTTDPGSVMDPQTGTNDLIGDQSGLDQSLRPMWPVLYLTDISTDPQNRAGDWQQGGRPTGPNAVFGSWKAAVRTVDKTATPATVTITPDKDPVKNNWMLGGGDPVPAGLTNQGYGAEVRWSVALAPGHSYRVQVLVHDGDQNKAGGDSGEACVLFCNGGSPEGTGGAGGSAPPPSCPAGTTVCGGGIDPSTCPGGTVCANGCCLPTNIIP